MITVKITREDTYLGSCTVQTIDEAISFLEERKRHLIEEEYIVSTIEYYTEEESNERHWHEEKSL
jgi:hypothetical protein